MLLSHFQPSIKEKQHDQYRFNYSFDVILKDAFVNLVKLSIGNKMQCMDRKELLKTKAIFW